LFEEEGVTLVPLPTGEEEPSIELVRVEQELAEAKGKLALTYDQAEHMAISHLRSLQVAAELFTWERAAHETKDLAAATKHAVVFEGWINQNKRSAIDAALVEQETAVIIENIELAEGEEPPVEIENNRFIRPFEAVTRLYGMPGYTDLDPTLFLAGFFFLFFGLSLTDVGYGLTLVVLSGGLLLFAKLKKPARAMLQLLFYIGIATVLVGMLFGGYFGIAPELIPEPLRAIQQFDPIGNPLPVFYLALGLGVFQVMVGLTLKIYSDYRNGRLASGLWEQGPWLLLFSIGIVYVLTVIEYLTVPSQTLLGLTYLGLLLLVIGAILRSTGLLNAITNIGGSLYGSVGFLSDVLSYSRLLALGLATTALAFAVNLIAGIVFNTHPIIGPVFAVFILIIGHVFTLAVNTLGAFIHSARLQFVEFFGKFVAGTGRSFNPLARSEDHITITEP
jgi:V/A-type H+-transporting ATPase subunit I